MPIDKEEFLEDYTPNAEQIDRDHRAAIFARNPEMALEPMKEEKDGFGFTPREVVDYLVNISEEGRDCAPVFHDLDHQSGPYSTPVYIREALQEASRGSEEYGSITADNGATVFAYLGDEDLDSET